MSNKNLAFTLIEVLIALMVFALMATITSSAMFYAFNTRERINTYADRLSQVQFAVNLLDQDTDQIINRPVRGNNMKKFPPFVALNNYVEFTRTGIINPEFQSRRSNLKRIAFICKNSNLIRRSWTPIDNIDRLKFEDKIILDNIKHCSFKYGDSNQQLFNDWKVNAVSSDQEQHIFPNFIQMSFDLEDWGNIKLILLIPEALYANV